MTMLSSMRRLLVLALVAGLVGCATATTTAKRTWYQLSTERFQMLTDGDPDRAEPLLRDLELFHQVLVCVLEKKRAKRYFGILDVL